MCLTNVKGFNVAVELEIVAFGERLDKPWKGRHCVTVTDHHSHLI